MKLYEINREERHFGFLFLTALISCPEFRREMFSLVASRASLQLDPADFDIYAEVAIFRDYWNKLGDHNNYTDELHGRRLAALREILGTLSVDLDLIDKHDMFWTGPIGDSKLWYPGKWSEAKIQEIETEKDWRDKRLWRCRWLCNAKPDVMIHSGNSVLFVEVKVESGMGSSKNGYDQDQTQRDIIAAGKRVIDWMKSSSVGRVILTQHENPLGITWGQVSYVYDKTRPVSDAGAEMIARHLKNMPKPTKA